MSEITKNQKLVQVTSIDVLLDNDTRITWQGFRPEHGGKKIPSTYFTTLTGNGTGSTAVSMVGIGAQGTNYPVEVTLLSGEAKLDGTSLRVDAPVMLPGTGSSSGADLVYVSETCTLKVCPKGVGSDAEVESGGAMRMGAGDPGSSPPPPPYPGGNSNH